nr:MAG TPA: hypothetical protein [Caudoviricetes sp.]
MAITNDEKQSIINAVLSSIRTNSRTIDQLTIVTEVADTDNFEIHGGKRVAFSKLRELILSKSGVGAINDKLPELDDVVEFKEVRNDITLIATQQTSVLGGIAGSTDAGYGAVYDPTRKRFFLMYYGEEAQTDASVVTAYGNFADEARFGASPSSGGGRVPVSGKLYLCKNDGGLYHWNGADLVVVAAKKHAITLQQAVAGTGTWSGPAFDDIRVGDTLTFTDTETQTATVFCEYKTSANARALCAAYAHANEANAVIRLMWLTDSGTYGTGGLPTSQTVVDWLDGKQTKLDDTTDVVIESETDTTDGLYLTDKAKMRLFIDQWNAAWNINGTVYGKYDPEHAPDALHPFMGNEIWMTYEEAILVMEYSSGFSAYQRISLVNIPIKTLLPIPLGLYNTYVDIMGMRELRAIRFIEHRGNAQVISQQPWFISDCINLTRIEGTFNISNMDASACWRFLRGSVNIKEFRASGLNKQLNLQTNSKLSLATMQYLVDNASTAITAEKPVVVTVHADVFAKLTGDMTNEAAAALPDDEKTAWAAVLTAATSKYISFATD